MQNFISSSMKLVINLAEFPNELLKIMRIPKPQISKTKSYGGFIKEDWEKVGNDMKRGLIHFEQSR